MCNTVYMRYGHCEPSIYTYHAHNIHTHTQPADEGMKRRIQRRTADIHVPTLCPVLGFTISRSFHFPFNILHMAYASVWLCECEYEYEYGGSVVVCVYRRWTAQLLSQFRRNRIVYKIKHWFNHIKMWYRKFHNFVKDYVSFCWCSCCFCLCLCVWQNKDICSNFVISRFLGAFFFIASSSLLYQTVRDVFTFGSYTF